MSIAGAVELIWFPGRLNQRDTAVGTSQDNVERASWVAPRLSQSAKSGII